MKAYRLLLMVFALMLVNVVSAQKNTNGNVVAKSRDISDNLDLQAVASIFGDSKDLEDFEKKLNDPSMQISNLDLNQDGYVDYLRVLEVAEGDVRVIVIQAVLGQDQFQDVATIELERQRATASSSPNVNIQIVGNPYIYGPNYIYEPYYYRTPVFFDFFWMPTYRPYYSPWYWGYYPTYYSYWAPVPYFRYNRNCYNYINQNNRYVYTDSRRVSRADRMYSNVRGNSLERQNPARSFEGRNGSVTNRYAFDKERTATRTASFSGDRGTMTTDRSNISSDRTSSTIGRNNVSGASRTATNSNRVGVNSSASDVRSTGSRVRSDFNATRTNVNSGETRVSIPAGTSTRSSSTIRSNTNYNQSNNRIERSTRSNSNNNSSTLNRSSNSGSFNRSSNSGSFNRSSAPAPSRSMSAPSSSRGGGSSSGRSIGR